MIPDVSETARDEWRASWPVVLASALGIGVSIFHTASLGILYKPLQDETGWQATQITLGLTIVSIVAVFAGPFMGNLIDRFGARRIGLPSMALYCGSLALLAVAGTSIWSWWLLWLLMAVVSLGIKPTLWTAAMVSLFSRSRGLAIAVALCGTGVVQMVLPYVTHQLLEVAGWRGTYLALGLGGAIIALPVMVLFFRDGRAGTGAAIKSKAAPIDRSNLPGVPLRDGFRSQAFLCLAIASFLAMAVVTSMSILFVPMLTSGGLSRASAISLVGLIGLFSIVGRLACGHMLDRFKARVIGAVVFLCPAAAGIMLLLFSGGGLQAAGIAMLIGLALGAEIDVFAYLTSRYLGVRNYGTFFGALSGIMGVGQGLGPLAIAASFDATGSYQIAQATIIPASLLMSLLVCIARPHRDAALVSAPRAPDPAPVDGTVRGSAPAL